jgi:diguanylate cyclase (GGDEF)-like protein
MTNETLGHAESDRIAAADWAQAGFMHAPVSLWLEDYSNLKAVFSSWRAAGVRDLRSYLRGDPARVKTCAAAIKVIAVNRRTLAMLEAPDQETLLANLHHVFRDDMFEGYISEMVQLWEGSTSFLGQSVNYSLTGKRIDIELRGVVLPEHVQDWSRVLVVIDDVTKREEARRELAVRTVYADGLFEHSPVSLWVEDFSPIKDLLDDLKKRAITDFRVFTDVHPDFVERCMAEIRVIDVNRRTLELFAAADKNDLLSRLGEVFRGEMHAPFREQLIDLWNGKLFQLREVVNYRLDGEPLYLLLQFSVLPGHEHDWSMVQIALTDITARKKAEEYLEFLGTHDVLTQLHNRTFYTDELVRLQRRRITPVTVMMIDVNGLKAINDESGHSAGDGLLRRTGEVLAKAVEAPCAIARIGGDEFAVLMPGMDAAAGEKLWDEIQSLVALNNQFYTPVVLELSAGIATSEAGDMLETTVRLADERLLAAKRAYYDHQGRSRRKS